MGEDETLYPLSHSGDHVSDGPLLHTAFFEAHRQNL